MATHYPGPHEVRFTIRVSGQEHTHKVNCDAGGTIIAGTPPGSISVTTKGGVSKNILTAATEYLTLFKALYHTTVEIARAELWQYTPGTYVALFITDLGLTAVGTNGTSATLAGQSTISFRSIGGNGMKLTWLENSTPAPSQELAPFSVAPFEAIRTYVIGIGGWIIARDGSFPNSAIRLSHGQNEATFKDRYRTT